MIDPSVKRYFNLLQMHGGEKSRFTDLCRRFIARWRFVIELSPLRFKSHFQKKEREWFGKEAIRVAGEGRRNHGLFSEARTLDASRCSAASRRRRRRRLWPWVASPCWPIKATLCWPTDQWRYIEHWRFTWIQLVLNCFVKLICCIHHCCIHLWL